MERVRIFYDIVSYNLFAPHNCRWICFSIFERSDLICNMMWDYNMNTDFVDKLGLQALLKIKKNTRHAVLELIFHIFTYYRKLAQTAILRGFQALALLYLIKVFSIILYL